MSVFLERNHLFLRDPHGGVEDVASMAVAGFNAIFCNVGDHAPIEWSTIRGRAGAAGVACGPWMRCATADNRFDFDRFHSLLRVADLWESPLIVNAESELKGSGSEVTAYINTQLGERDAAISMESWPFDNVDWTPLAARPLLPQLFKSLVGYHEQEIRNIWHQYGVRCVVLTFGAFGGSTATEYDRAQPFGVYSADDCHGDYAAWSAIASTEPCLEPEEPEEPMPVIGPDHGITATFNRLRDLDPKGTLLVKEPDPAKPGQTRWPSISTLSDPERPGGPIPVSSWKAYDKGERALTILVTDHDREMI
jgi:hypothetical protein